MKTESIAMHATYKDVRLPSERLRAMLSANHVAEDIINGCEMALHELLTNLVDHAYEGDGSKTITVNIAYQKTSILIETQDTGKPAKVDLNKISMPEPEHLAEGGYGLALIQALMDEVKYKSNNGKNVWQLVKHI